MNTKPCKFLLIAVISMTLGFAVGCEKEPIKDDEGTLSYGTLKDIDGNLYRTVRIGMQEWMAENLKVTRYNDGQAINQIPDSVHSWMGGKSFLDKSLYISEELINEDGRYGIYPYGQIDGLNSDAEVIEAYGLHYNWFALETEKLCPAGWRVPTLNDWEKLFSYLMDNYDHIKNLHDVGAALKSCRQEDSHLIGDCNTTEHPRWNKEGIDYWFLEMQKRIPEIELREHAWPLAGTDEFGFSALPAGKYFSSSWSGLFGTYGVGYSSEFWVDHKWIMDVPRFCFEKLEVIGTFEGEYIGTYDAVQGTYNKMSSQRDSIMFGRIGEELQIIETLPHSLLSGYPVRCVRIEP
jgi:hypothetical protein